ncbi:hypothetical protein IAT40_004633 [Kwoniella sp. CBS 6097]
MICDIEMIPNPIGQLNAVSTQAAHGGSKPPNFLQKLYDFLALDPHPCPEIMYWASDSRQLVIAQPDRLAKEILPKLFKHDKIASFGRQLNIYGFSRLFPGRQFKDAEGNVSDASVWAHPTLHRLSTSAELSSIKRRAPPKLMRTRRLANGQVVRTRAGPGVIEKARQVKEAMSKDRDRNREGKPYGALGIGNCTSNNSLAVTANKSPANQDMNGSLPGAGRSKDVSADLADLPEGVHTNSNGWFQSSGPGTITHYGAKTGLEETCMLSQTPSPLVSTIESIQPFYQQPHPHPQPYAGEHTSVVAQFQLQSSTLASTTPLNPLNTGLANKLNLLKDRPYVSCPASIHTSPTLNPVRLNLQPFTATIKTPWAFLPSTNSNEDSIDADPMSSDVSFHFINGTLNGVTGSTFAFHPPAPAPPAATAPAPSSTQTTFPPTFIPSLAPTNTSKHNWNGSVGSAVNARRIAAPAAPVPAHFPQLQSSINSSIATTTNATATATATVTAKANINANTGTSTAIDTGVSGQMYGTFQPSPTDIILSTPQPVFSPLPVPPLNAPLPVPVPVSLNICSVNATVPSSFGPTPLCSRDQITYVSAHWDKEDSWAKAQATITGRQGVLHHSGIRPMGTEIRSDATYVSGKTEMFHGVHGGKGENGTIDPKWVSPAGSVWSTPSVTRVPSPQAPAPAPAPDPNTHMRVGNTLRTSDVSVPPYTTSPQYQKTQMPGPPPPFVFYKPSHLPNVVQLEEEEVGIKDQTTPDQEQLPIRQGELDLHTQPALGNAAPRFSGLSLPGDNKGPSSYPYNSGDSSPLISLTLPPTPDSTSHSLLMPQTQLHVNHTPATSGIPWCSPKLGDEQNAPGNGSGLCSTFDNGSRWYE